jgi:glycosyltransferase involved in cell wall biosynthesis
MERFIDQRAAALLASSGHAAQLLAKQYGVPAGRIHTLHDSVDPGLFRPREGFAAAALAARRRRWELPEGRPVVAYLGLLAPYQGTELLLQALRLLAEESAAPCGLVMGFPDVARYRRLAEELGLGGQVTLTGPVAYEEAPALLALGDVAVAPKLSATEGSGKLLTYMAAGLPVAAFDTPVHREYLGELGHYALPGDAKSLAEAIREALAKPEESGRRGRELRRRVERCYTWERAAQQIEGVYAGMGIRPWV